MNSFTAVSCVKGIFSCTVGSFKASIDSSNAISLARVFIIKAFLCTELECFFANSFKKASSICLNGFFLNTKLPAYDFLPVKLSSTLTGFPSLSNCCCKNKFFNAWLLVKSPKGIMSYKASAFNFI